jgi:hypothetical protein
MSNNKLSTLLQKYNERHYWEYMGYVAIHMGDGCSGYLKFEDKVIPNSAFDDYEQLEDLLMND